MNVLAFDTATDVCSVALRTGPRNGTRTLHDHRTEPRQQARLLLPMIDALVTEAGITLADLDVVVYGRGPGSFTGVRIAVAAAQGISLASGARTLGISTLASVAQVAHDTSGATSIIASLDARMSEVYLGQYTLDKAAGLMRLQGTERVDEPQALQMAQQQTLAQDEHGTLFAGSGAERYADQVTGGIVPDVWPTGLSLLRLAEPAIAATTLGSPGDAEPVYLRDKVALTEQERGVV